jgi:hypothetical protein
MVTGPFLVRTAVFVRSTCFGALDGDSRPLVESHGEDEATSRQEMDETHDQQTVFVDSVSFILEYILHL